MNLHYHYLVSVRDVPKFRLALMMFEYEMRFQAIENVDNMRNSQIRCCRIVGSSNRTGCAQFVPNFLLSNVQR